MSRQKLPDGTWRDLGPLELVGSPPGEITRRFVPVVAPEPEPPPPVIERRVTMPAPAAAAPPAAPDPKPNPGPTARMRQVWEAVEKYGTQVEAGRAIGASQGSIQSALKGYMRLSGLEGPLPGYSAPKAKPHVAPEPDPVADKLSESAETDASLSVDQRPQGRLVTISTPSGVSVVGAPSFYDQPEHSAILLPEGAVEPAEVPSEPGADLQSEALDVSPVGTTSQSDKYAAELRDAAADVERQMDAIANEVSPGPWRADELALAATAAAEDHWDAAAERWIDAPPLVRSSLDWLLEHGPTWTRDEAETWFVMFERATALSYPPTRGEAGQ